MIIASWSRMGIYIAASIFFFFFFFFFYNLTNMNVYACLRMPGRPKERERQRKGKREWSMYQLSAVRTGEAHGVGVSAWFGCLCAKFFTPLVLSQQHVSPRLLGLVLIPTQPAATQHEEKGLPYFPNLLLCRKRLTSRGHCLLPPSRFISPSLSNTPSTPCPTSATPALCLQLINLVTPFNHTRSTSCRRGEGESSVYRLTVTEKEGD